jgi:hypothetical protein
VRDALKRAAAQSNVSMLTYAADAIDRHLSVLEREPPAVLARLSSALGANVTLNYQVSTAVHTRLRALVRRMPAVSEGDARVLNPSIAYAIRECIMRDLRPMLDSGEIYAAPKPARAPRSRTAADSPSLLMQVSFTPAIYAYLQAHERLNVSAAVRAAVDTHLDKVAADPRVGPLTAPSLGRQNMKGFPIRVPKPMHERLLAAAAARNASMQALIRVCVAHSIAARLARDKAAQA